MTVRIALLAALACAGLALASASARPPRAGSGQGTETYVIDSGHSSVVFKIKHLDVAWFYGRFNELEGGYVLDHEDPTKSTVELEIPTASIDTNSGSRDSEMRSAGFFDAEGHPTITFRSTKVKVVDEDHWKVTGELGCKGRVEEIVVDLHFTGATDHERFGYRTGFEASFEIDRATFEIGAGLPETMLSQKVYVMIGIEGIRT